MDYFIKPSKVSGEVILSGSKSLTHRAIICSFLSKSLATIKNVYLSNDIKETINALKSLGAKIEVKENYDLVIESGNSLSNITINESGSTLRFIIPLLMLFKKDFIINSTKTLLDRPLDDYYRIFDLQRINDTQLLFRYKEIDLSNIVIDGSKTSQFASGILFLMPLLGYKTTLTIKNLESKNYVLLTLSMLSQFGIKYQNENFKITIEYQAYQMLENIEIEGDFSSASNFLVLGTINNDLKLTNLNNKSIQADKMIFNLNNVTYVDEIKSYYIKKNNYCSLEFDIKDAPDVGPILMILLTKTGGVIRNVNRLKYKESDRMQSMINELVKFDIDIKVVDNDCYIQRKEIIDTDEVINTYNDHRIFMAFSILATISKKGFMIKNSECLNKSFPTFIEVLKSLKVECYEI